MVSLLHNSKQYIYAIIDVLTICLNKILRIKKTILNIPLTDGYIIKFACKLTKIF